MDGIHDLGGRQGFGKVKRLEGWVIPKDGAVVSTARVVGGVAAGRSAVVPFPTAIGPPDLDQGGSPVRGRDCSPCTMRGSTRPL